MNAAIRQIHRWFSLAFAVIVAAIFIMMGLGRPPANWVFYVPLAPLAVLLVTGLYLFALPYVRKPR